MRTLLAGPGIYVIAPAAARQAIGRATGPGTLAITGQPSTVARSGNAALYAGAFTIAGGLGSFAVSRAAQTRTAAITGGASSTARVRNLNAQPGPFTITGQPTAQGQVYTLLADRSSAQITGRAVSSSLSRFAAMGPVAIAGRAAAKAVARPSLGQAVTIAGQPASRGVSRSAATVSFAIVGSGAFRAISFAPPATAQRAITGRSTAIANGRFSSTGGFVLGGVAAVLRSARQFAAGPASFALTGSSAGYSYSHTSGYALGAGTGQYTISMFGDGNTKHRPFMKRKRVRFGLTP